MHEDSAELYMFDIFSVSLPVHLCKSANKTKPAFLMKLADTNVIILFFLHLLDQFKQLVFPKVIHFR